MSSGIKRLRSRTQPPWGAAIKLAVTMGITNGSLIRANLLVRFFTVNTTTEVGKMILPANITTLHVANDTTNVVSSANASNLATSITLANEIKTDFNAHIASTSFHSVADGTNTVTSANATDLASVITLANEMKGDYNAHRSQSGVHPYNDSYWEVTSAAASDQTSANTLLNEIKADYNLHRVAYGLYANGYGIAPGTYDVGIGAYGFLNQLAEDQVFTAGATTTVSTFIWPGDLNGDDNIDLTDVLIPNNQTFGFGSDITGTLADWLTHEQTELGVWTVAPTARRRTY